MTITNTREAEAILDSIGADIYSVTFRYSESVYCSNYCMADSEEDIRRAYSRYNDITITKANKDSARYEITKKHKPLVIA